MGANENFIMDMHPVIRAAVPNALNERILNTAWIHGGTLDRNE